MAHYFDKFCRAKLDRGAVKSLEYAMIAMFVVVISAGAISTPSAHMAPAAIQVASTK